MPDVDRLVTIAQADADVVAARMTGGGFGGAIVALARRGKAGEARSAGLCELRCVGQRSWGVHRSVVRLGRLRLPEALPRGASGAKDER